MNLQRIKHTLLRLSPEEKVLSIGSLLVILGSFMPWYSVETGFERAASHENAFSGDLGVIGFVVFLFMIINLLLLLGESLHIRIPTFGHKKENILLFLMAESAFLVLLIIAIYTKRSLDFTNAELRFGIYTALVGTCLGSFAAFAQLQKKERKSVEEFFGHEEAEEDMQEESQPAVHTSRVVAEVEREEPEQMQMDALQTYEEDRSALAELEVTQTTPNETSSFLIKEALRFTPPAETSGEQEAPKKKPSMNFYEDA
jgi:hypothetical protein